MVLFKGTTRGAYTEPGKSGGHCLFERRCSYQLPPLLLKAVRPSLFLTAPYFMEMHAKSVFLNTKFHGYTKVTINSSTKHIMKILYFTKWSEHEHRFKVIICRPYYVLSSKLIAPSLCRIRRVNCP